LIKLAGTNSFWVIATLSVDKLSKIDIPGINGKKGSDVKIYFPAAWGESAYRMGTVKRLKVELEASGRMAELIIEIQDPLSLQENNKGLPHLVLGAFVRVEITGRTLKDVLPLPETVVHSGQKLWLVTEKNTLDIKAITPIWQEQGLIFIDAQQIQENARIISSNLSTPVQGMTVRTQAITPIFNPSITQK